MDEEVKRKRPGRRAETSEFVYVDEQMGESTGSKIVRVDVPDNNEIITSVIENPKPEKQNGNLHRVIIRGKERYLTESAIKAASRDKKLGLQIPEDSTFSMPQFKKCKDC